MSRAAPHALALAAAALAVALAGPAPAGSRMLNAEEASEFRAVGRLNVAGRRFCTATLVSPREVITAAHCLSHPRTGAPVPVTEMRFVAGLDRGEHAALRGIERVYVAADFRFDNKAPERSVPTDLALAVLDRPIPAEAARPLALSDAPGEGPLSIVSYSRDRAQAPSLTRPCRRIPFVEDFVLLDCPATYGASGAPVLRGEGAAARIVGIVSAIGIAPGNRHRGTLAATADAAGLDRLRAVAPARTMPPPGAERRIPLRPRRNPDPGQPG